jgi:hypothetical protein
MERGRKEHPGKQVFEWCQAPSLYDLARMTRAPSASPNAMARPQHESLSMMEMTSCRCSGRLSLRGNTKKQYINAGVHDLYTLNYCGGYTRLGARFGSY